MNAQDASQEYLTAEVEAADPLRRIAMLHERAARSVRDAVRHIDRKDFAKAHEAFVGAKNIVLHFLASIPESDESELAAHLRGLLQYAYRELGEGNLRKDRGCAEAALKVLRTLAEGWSELDARRRPSGPRAPEAGSEPEAPRRPPLTLEA